MGLMAIAAVLAAVCYGAGAAVQQRQAARAPSAAAGRPRLLVLLARQPIWLLGFAAQIAGFAAHAVALRYGPLAAVQLVVAGELVVAVVLVRLWSTQPLPASCWAAALTVVAAVAGFVVLTGHGYAHHSHAGAGRAGLAAGLLGVAAAVAAVIGLRSGRPLPDGVSAGGVSAGGLSAGSTARSAGGARRAVLLAVAAGLADACSAVVTLGFAHTAGYGLVALAGSWTVYALIVCGIGNVLLTQTAYQAGRPLLTLPVIAAVAPAASVLAGTVLLGQTPRIGTAGGIVAGLIAVIAILALARLARTAPQPAPAGFTSDRPAAREPLSACGRPGC